MPLGAPADRAANMQLCVEAAAAGNTKERKLGKPSFIRSISFSSWVISACVTRGLRG